MFRVPNRLVLPLPLKHFGPGAFFAKNLTIRGRAIERPVEDIGDAQ
jgi:hypothetical protein